MSGPESCAWNANPSLTTVYDQPFAITCSSSIVTYELVPSVNSSYRSTFTPPSAGVPTIAVVDDDDTGGSTAFWTSSPRAWLMHSTSGTAASIFSIRNSSTTDATTSRPAPPASRLEVRSSRGHSFFPST